MTQTITAYKLISKDLTTYAGYQWVMENLIAHGGEFVPEDL